MRDPLHRPGAANIGAAGLSRTSPGGRRWQLGEVVEYNSGTHTATVRTHAGQPLRDVPQIKAIGGMYDHLESGTVVVITWDLGIPAIIGCMDFGSLRQSAIVPPTLTGVDGYGDADPTQPVTGGNSHKPPIAPTDMSQGDWAVVGSHGNHVAVLGGALTLVGSPTAQVRSFGVSGTLQSVARRLESISDFGTWRVENLEGRTSFVLRAGSSQSTETGLGEENWTIRLDLGASGDVLDFVITEPMGRVLFRLHAGSDGRVQLYGDGGVDVSSGSRGTRETRHDVAGDRRSIVSGNDATRVSGDKSDVTDGDHGVETTGKASHVIGGDWTHVIGGNAAHAVAGDALRTVAGDDECRIGGASNLRTDKTVSVTATGDVNVSSTEGALDLKASGRARLDGDKVVLGKDGRHPLPLFDTYLRDHAEFMSHLITALSLLTPLPGSAPALATQMALMQKFLVLTTQGFPYESRRIGND